MKQFLVFASALALSAAMAEAKTFVYCSEASPANFDPATTTGGNDLDAFNAYLTAHAPVTGPTPDRVTRLP